jgi:hypothetical protein
MDGQVGLVRLIRLQTDNFHLFLCHKQTNDKLQFSQLANSKQTEESHMGFPFPFSI